jgi:Ca-activated chloride channel homolog
MTFADPLHLLAVLAVPLVVAVWAVSRRRRARFAVRHPAGAMLSGLLRRGPRWRQLVPATLLALGAVAMSTAYAKPRHTVHVPVEKASVVLVTDESGSMQADDVQPSRLQAAQSAARSFLHEAPGPLLVGFESFATGVRENITPTTDRDTVNGAIDRLNADGSTATGDALSTALDQLAARKGRDGRTAPAAIVLLSDGKRTNGSDPLAAAARAKRLSIPIYTVALGSADGIVTTADGQTVSVPPDPETLREIAAASGGRAYAVDDAGTLEGVYRDLGSKIGTRAEQREVTVAFIAGGLVLLLGGMGTGVAFRGRLV